MFRSFARRLGAPIVGTKFHPFTLDKVVGSKGAVTSVQFPQQGKYSILFFYPLDFTFVCPSEILAFDVALPEFAKRNCYVLGSSCDSHFSHIAWKNTPLEKGGLGDIELPLNADFNKTLASKFNVLTDSGVALRGLFLFDKDGVCRHSLVNDLPLGRNVDEALRILDALQYTEQHGEVCPANWKKGAKAMKPSAAGVADYLSSTHKH